MSCACLGPSGSGILYPPSLFLQYSNNHPPYYYWHSTPLDGRLYCVLEPSLFHLLLLQVTSPLRRLADLDAMIDLYLGAQAPAAVSVVKWDEPRPEKLKKLQDGKLLPYLGVTYEGPRQALPQPYALNGAFYLIQRDIFLKAGRFFPDGTIGFEMAPSRSHNLDSPADLQILEAMLKAGHWQLETLPAVTFNAK